MSSSETLPLYTEHRAVQGNAEDMAPSPSTYGLNPAAFRGAPSLREGPAAIVPRSLTLFFLA